MALSLVLQTVPNAAVVHKPSGRSYAANALGQVTIPATDAADLQSDTLIFAANDFVVGGVSISQPRLIPIFWSGATADRPGVTQSGTPPGSLQYPPPASGTPFNDTTTSSVVYFVTRQISSTRWVDGTGAAV